MEGRYPNGLLLAMTNCTEPAKEEEFNYWYNYIHIPDSTGTGVFRNGVRYVNTSPKPGEGKYVVTLETEWEDVSKAWEAQREIGAKLRERGRGFPEMQVAKLGVYKRTGGEYRAALRPVRGILIVQLDAKDAAREQEFYDWYVDVHIPDILDTGLYHTAYFYESLDSQQSGSKYLALFESDHGDPSKAANEISKVNANWEQRGRRSDTVSVSMLVTARRIWPMD